MAEENAPDGEPAAEVLLAKRADGRTQTLLEHTRWALIALKEILRRPGVQAKARWLGIDDARLVRSTFVAVALHDAGKATHFFQRSIRKGRRARGLPHPLVSALIVGAILADGEGWLWPDWPEPVLEALAILGHHTELYAGLYRVVGFGDVNALDVKGLVDWLPRVMAFWSALGFVDAGAPPRLNPKLTAALDRVRRARPHLLMERLQERVHEEVPQHDKARLKAVYTLLLALLTEADHAASRAFEDGRAPLDGLVMPSAPARVAIRLREAIGRAIAPRALRAFQEAAEAAGAGTAGTEEAPRTSGLVEAPPGRLSAGEQVVLAVPCGRGKTEAALLWWAALAGRGRVDRLVWAMPTQVTSNSLYDRLVELTDAGAAGLYHGHSLLERIRRTGQETWHPQDGDVRPLEGARELFAPPEDETPLQTDPESLRSENRIGEWFSRAITVTTVDHLLYAFCHGFGKADMALGNLQTAAIVFDEVHYYDPRLLAHLREAFRLLRAMGIPHLLMSGTLPPSLLGQFGIRVQSGEPGRSVDDAYCLIEDHEGEGWGPFRLLRRDERLLVECDPPAETPAGRRLALNPAALEMIAEGRCQGQVQVIVLNTVRRAQAAYLDLVERFGPEQVGLLHSRLAYADRRRLEEAYLSRLRAREAGLILVATQVVEVSLDLSADRMLTELAPLDALGQRAGRVHRGAAEPDGAELWVWLPVDGLPYERGTLALERGEGLLERSWHMLPTGVPRLGAWRRLCDDLYKDRTLGPSNLPELFHLASLFGPSPREIRLDEDSGRILKPRAIFQPTIDVVARDLIDELGDEAFDELWLVPVPQWWVFRSFDEHGDHFFIHPHNERVYYVCTWPYRHDFGFEEWTASAPSSALIEFA